MLDLIANHMQATLTFMRTNGKPSKIVRAKAAEFVWQTAGTAGNLNCRKYMICLCGRRIIKGKVHSEEQVKILKIFWCQTLHGK